MTYFHDRPRWIPTPDEIAAAAAEIRAGWSERERLLRLNATMRPLPVNAIWIDDTYDKNVVWKARQ
jgi:hypothetical protein